MPHIESSEGAVWKTTARFTYGAVVVQFSSATRLLPHYWLSTVMCMSGGGAGEEGGGAGGLVSSVTVHNVSGVHGADPAQHVFMALFHHNAVLP